MSEVFFGVKKTEKFFLDKEKTQFIEYKKMNEGERIDFQDSISGKIVLDQATGKAEVDSKTGSDRRALVNTAVVGFKVMLTDDEFVSDMSKWSELFEQMDGDLAQILYDKISEFNGFKKK